MNKDWKQRLLATAKRRDEGQEDEFIQLVDQAKGQCTLEVARTLMKTFSDSPDYGTQERVVSVLASANERDVTTAILEELPRLLKEAPEWAENLVGPEVDNRPALLQSVVEEVSDDIRQSLRVLLSKEDFIDFYPNAKNIKV